MVNAKFCLRKNEIPLPQLAVALHIDLKRHSMYESSKNIDNIALQTHIFVVLYCGACIAPISLELIPFQAENTQNLLNMRGKDIGILG